jgi:hypothetical protein
MLSPHETLFRQDTWRRRFYHDQRLDEASRIATSGEETVVTILTRGDSYAESHALSGGHYPATAEAVSSTRASERARTSHWQ